MIQALFFIHGLLCSRTHASKGAFLHEVDSIWWSKTTTPLKYLPQYDPIVFSYQYKNVKCIERDKKKEKHLNQERQSFYNHSQMPFYSTLFQTAQKDKTLVKSASAQHSQIILVSKKICFVFPRWWREKGGGVKSRPVSSFLRACLPLPPLQFRSSSAKTDCHTCCFTGLLEQERPPPFQPALSSSTRIKSSTPWFWRYYNLLVLMLDIRFFIQTANITVVHKHVYTPINKIQHGFKKKKNE